MGCNQNKPIVVGIVGHIPPEFLADFKNHVEKYSHFRLIRFQESNNKLWIVSREENK
jgi:hypothetical protein